MYMCACAHMDQCVGQLFSLNLLLFLNYIVTQDGHELLVGLGVATDHCVGVCVCVWA